MDSTNQINKTKLDGSSKTIAPVWTEVLVLDCNNYLLLEFDLIIIYRIIHLIG